jgi:hypothetical protein
MALAGDGSVVIAGESTGSYTGGILDFIILKYNSVPELQIARTGPNTAVVSWPYPSTGYGLQQNVNLNSATWTAAPEAVANNGTSNFIIVNPPTGNRFFRLLKP